MKSINKKSFTSFTFVLFSFFLSLLLSACGGGGSSDDDDDSDDTRIGVFTDSPVQGVYYMGPNFSGLTNEKGEFNYKQGDLVSFALGGIKFGSVTGAPIVTPFTLFDLTPPTTEAEIKAELVKEKSDFHKVMNIVTLLVLLDKDGNPDNGIDLSGLHEQLEDFEEPIDQNAFYFSGDLMYSLYDFGIDTDYINFEVPLVHFYESLGIQVSVKALKKKSKDLGDDGTINYVLENTFDATNRLTKVTEDEDNDSNFDSISIFAYDVNGNRTVNTTQNDTDDDGTVDDEYFNNRTYDGDGRTLTSESGRAGPTGYKYSYTYTYDARGNQLTSYSEYDSNNDGINNTSLNTRTYNAEDQLLTDTSDRDNDADGTIDNISIDTYTYDSNGNETSYENKRNNNADTSTEFDFISTTTKTYDSSNQLINSVKNEDSNNDEVIDRIITTVYTYDASGNRTSKKESSDNDANGTVDAVDTRTYTYDASGRQLTYLRTNDHDNNAATPHQSSNSNTYTYDAMGNQLTSYYSSSSNGTLSNQSKDTNTYDSQSRLTSTRYQRDANGDGVYTTDNISDFTYNANGRMSTSTRKQGSNGTYTYRSVSSATYNTEGIQTSYTYEEDTDNDGTNELVATYTHTLDAENTVVSTKEEVDNNNDGAVDVVNETIYEYVTISDGLAYLLTHSLDNSAECNIGNGGGFLLLGLIGEISTYCQTGSYYYD